MRFAHFKLECLQKLHPSYVFCSLLYKMFKNLLCFQHFGILTSERPPAAARPPGRPALLQVQHTSPSCHYKFHMIMMLAIMLKFNMIIRLAIMLRFNMIIMLALMLKFKMIIILAIMLKVKLSLQVQDRVS